MYRLASMICTAYNELARWCVRSALFHFVDARAWTAPELTGNTFATLFLLGRRSLAFRKCNFEKRERLRIPRPKQFGFAQVRKSHHAPAWLIFGHLRSKKSGGRGRPVLHHGYRRENATPTGPLFAQRQCTCIAGRGEERSVGTTEPTPGLPKGKSDGRLFDAVRTVIAALPDDARSAFGLRDVIPFKKADYEVIRTNLAQAEAVHSLPELEEMGATLLS